MTLKDTITDDMKTAMRAKDSERLGTIRMLLAAVKQKEVDERVVVDDATLVGLVDKLIKQRKDAQSQFAAAGRDCPRASQQVACPCVISQPGPRGHHLGVLRSG